MSRWICPCSSSILNDQLANYGLEGIAMPYTMEDFERDVEQKILRKLTPEQLMSHLTPEQMLSRLPREEIEKYLREHQPPQAQDKPFPEPRETRP